MINHFALHNAMDANTRISDREKCIRCLMCVYICLDKVLEITDIRPTYSVIVNVENPPEKLSKKESKYYLN